MKPAAKPRKIGFLVPEDDHRVLNKRAEHDGNAVTDDLVNRPLNGNDFVTSPCNAVTGNEQPPDAEKGAWNRFNLGDC